MAASRSLNRASDSYCWSERDAASGGNSTSAPENRWYKIRRIAYAFSMNKLPPIAEMQQAFLEQDTTYDGIFLLGVRTTGIFCRPTCPARKPLPKNVVYFATAKEALAAGFRPCKRCRPMDVDNQPEWVKPLLAATEREPSRRFTEQDLAELGIDPATARRHFQRHFGMTFQAYARA